MSAPDDAARRRADVLLGELLELDAAARAGRLAEVEVDEPSVSPLLVRLLAAAGLPEIGAIGRWREAAADLVGEAPTPGDSAPAAGDRIGVWRIVAPLARGGMSRVYVAERAEGFRQRAALKLFTPAAGEPGSLARRFEQERQILAALDHPSIARVLDGGVAADGRPYLVLELIDGEPIDAWCARRALGLAARLELLAEVARAVEHAHRNLVVHRDLKPSNVLVARDGAVKLLDFGIAKVLEGSAALAEIGLLAPETRTLTRPLTPAYASPEQVRGLPITTSSDVYQLGLLLYELLAGHPAHLFREDGWRELERVVCETPTPRLGRQTDGARARSDATAAALAVPSDLETIVLKALAKEPERRYGSAAQLAEDLERFLAGRPVLARPDTLVYRTRKFVARHRLAVAAAAAVATALAVGAAAALWQGHEAARQRDVARREAERSDRARGLLLDVFEAADEGSGAAVTARELVARSAERLRREVPTGARRAELLEVLASAYSGLGLHAEAAGLRGEAVEIARRERGGESLEAARALDALGLTLVLAGEYPRAIESLEAALRLRRTLLGEVHPDVASTSSHLSYALGVKGEVDRSLALRERVLALRRQIHGPEHAEVAQALNDLGRSLRFVGRLDEAERHLREAIAMRRRLDETPAEEVSVPLSNLALVLLDRGALAAAGTAADEALALASRDLRPGHPRLAGRIQLLGSVRLAERRLDEAEAKFREALVLYRSSLPPEHFSIAEAELALAETLLVAGRSAEAEAIAAAAHGRLARAFPARSFRAGQAAALLGACRAANGAGHAAVALAEEGLAAIVAELGPASPLARRARGFVERARRAAPR